MASVLLLGMYGEEIIFADKHKQSDQKKTQSKTYDFEKLSKDPQFIKSMITHMKKNHDFTQNILKSMLNDPVLRTQMLGHMTENQDAMKQMSQMMKNPSESKKMMPMDHSSMKMNSKKSDPSAK